MELTRHQFLRLVAGASAWLAARPLEAALARASIAARPLPLDEVRLTGGPLRHAQQLDAAYLLSLDPDRMLCHYRRLAGLEPKAPGYTGWDADGRQLTGHIAGHHLSAVSLMFAATGDQRFKQRANYIVGELKLVQDAHGDGFAGALQGAREAFAEVSKGNIRSANFDLNGLWSPWYTLHKTFAGLRDAWRHTGNRTALDIEIRFAQWAARILDPMDDAMVQRMLATEFGGMNEVFADLYADTGDRRWLDLSYKFEHRAVFEPLRRREDPLNGLHGNTQVPKAIGLAARYICAGDPADYAAASFFWDTVVDHHTFATGGHGKDEYFREPDHLGNITGGRTAETCNVYNMLKLTRLLFSLKPDVRYAEFHERALFNHILGSMDPDDGATCYMVPVGDGVRREYADMQRSFTCCVGTGMESHALHGYGIYYEAGDRLWVNLYAPTHAQWRSADVALSMQTDFPEGGSATLSIESEKPRAFTLSLRRPSWAGDGFRVSINGRPITALTEPGTYIDIAREWRRGDTVAMTLPRRLSISRLPDRPARAAVMYGPLVLAGDLGPAERSRDDGDGDGVRAAVPEAPVLVTDRPIDEWLQPITGRANTFRAPRVGRFLSGGSALDVEFVPFYLIHRRTYAAYWDLLTPAAFAEAAAAYRVDHERQNRILRASVGALATIEPSLEKALAFAGEDTTIVRAEGRPGRRAGRWFSYVLPIDPSKPMAVVATYNTDNRKDRTFDVVADGQRIGTGTLPQSSVSKFIDVVYGLPQELVANKTAITVKFEATGSNDTATVFAVRTVRRNEL